MWSSVFGLATVLALAVLMLPVARRSRIPYTVILAVAGVALGFFMQYLGVSAGELAHGSHTTESSAWRQITGAIAQLRITSDAILFLFLPALVFESALSLDLRKLLAEMRSILFLAIIGVVISTVIVGVTVAAVSGVALVVCLLLGAIVSATDPVAVIALFKDLNAPKRLAVLVEGESLFNDATAIVISAIFLSMLTLDVNLDFVASLMNFLVVFLGGILVGIAIARPAASLMGAMRRDPLIIVTLTVALPFIAFVVAEHFLHVSGVMAVVASGLIVGSVGRRLVAPQVFAEIEHAWHHLGFWATSLIFILVGLIVPRLLGENVLTYWREIVALIIAATFARALIIYVMLPVLARFGAGQSVSRSYQTIMFWGGLRGAVSLALALIVLEADGIDMEARAFVGVLVTSFVLFTLLFQATTIHGVMQLIGLDKLPRADQALRDRSVANAMQHVREELDRLAVFHEVDDMERQDVAARYASAIADARDKADVAGALSDDEWVVIGLGLALAQERQLYLTKFGEGFTTPDQLREALARLDEVSDALKSNALDWGAAAHKSIVFRRMFRYALTTQRRLGWTGFLARALARRFGVLNLMRQVLREQRESGVAEIEAILPDKAQAHFRQLFEERYQIVNDSADALSIQYPEYAAALQRRDLTLAGLRLEEAAFDRLLEQSVIGPEIHSDLIKRLSGTESATHELPPLHLRLEPSALIAKVPFFAELNKGRRKRLARLLKTRFAVPEEVIIQHREVGEEMYFISSGAIRVILPDGDVVLGTGDFFGELALITNDPRNADVHALGYCTLLVLKKRDFKVFIRRYPDLRERIQRVAIERLGAGTVIDI